MHELAIPKRHLTAPQHLLSWPSSPVKLTGLGRRYPLELEVKRPKQAPISSADTIRDWLAKLSITRIRDFTRLYFIYFHPQYLILDEDYFYSQHLNRAFRNGFGEDIESCLVLVVFALGIMIGQHVEHGDEWTESELTLGSGDCELGLMELAAEIFRKVYETDWISIQCLLLIG